MNMDDVKHFAKNEKELKTLRQTVRIHSQDIGMEFGIEKWSMLAITSGNWDITKRVEQVHQYK